MLISYDKYKFNEESLKNRVYIPNECLEPYKLKEYLYKNCFIFNSEYSKNIPIYKIINIKNEFVYYITLNSEEYKISKTNMMKFAYFLRISTMEYYNVWFVCDDIKELRKNKINDIWKF